LEKEKVPNFIVASNTNTPPPPGVFFFGKCYSVGITRKKPGILAIFF